MSLISYDLNKIRIWGIPASSLNDWMAVVAKNDVKEAYWAMRSPVDTYGVKAFWAYKDQNMMARYGRQLSDAEKEIYLENMMKDEADYSDEE